MLSLEDKFGEWKSKYFDFHSPNILQGSTLGVNIDLIKKSFKQKLFEIKFSNKKVSESISVSPIRVELWGFKKSINSQILKHCKCFERPSSAPMGDRDMLSLTFFLENSILNNFCLKLFLIGSIFTPNVEPWRQIRRMKIQIFGFSFLSLIHISEPTRPY